MGEFDDLIPGHQAKSKPKPKGSAFDDLIPPTDFSQVAANSGSSAVAGGARQPRAERPQDFAKSRSGLMNFGHGMATPIADAIVGISQMTGIGSDQWRRDTMARIDSVRGTTPGKVGTVAGEIGLLAAPASKVASLPSWGARIAANSGLGALVGGTQGVREGGSRLTNLGLGAAAGGAGGVVGEGFGAGVRGLKRAV